MDNIDWTTVAQLVVPLVGALVIALVGFWLALRHDAIQWSRQRRAELYIDLLAEGFAELSWMEHTLTEIEMGEPLPHPFVESRLPPRERSLLGARTLAFASRDVARRFHAVSFNPLVTREMAPATKIKVRLAFDDLEKQIRRELRAD